MRGLLLAGAAVAGAAAAGWAAIVKAQGDSHIVFEPDSCTWGTDDGRSVHGEITLVNRGKAGCVVHKVEGTIADGSPGRVLVTRRGSRPPERGWWQSNCLLPGESCVAEIDVELDEEATGSLVIELDAHEIGRRLLVHRIHPVPVRRQPAAVG